VYRICIHLHGVLRMQDQAIVTCTCHRSQVLSWSGGQLAMAYQVQQ